jgi:ankyrin repeat protein
MTPGSTALHYACAYCDEWCVRQLLEHTPSRQVAAVDSKGLNPLMHAVSSDSDCPRVTALLLAHDAQLQLRAATADLCSFFDLMPTGTTALMLAARWARLERTSLLLEHIPDEQLLATNAHGRNALSYAADGQYERERGPALVRMLLARCAPEQVAADDTYGYSPLKSVVGEWDAGVRLSAEDLDMMQQLLSYPNPQRTLDAVLLDIVELDAATEEGGVEQQAIVLLVAKGAVLPDSASAKARETMRRLVVGLAQYKLMPGAAREATQAIVDVALRCRKRTEE